MNSSIPDVVMFILDFAEPDIVSVNRSVVDATPAVVIGGCLLVESVALYDNVT